MHRLLPLGALLLLSAPLAARHISKPPALPAPKTHKLEIRPTAWHAGTKDLEFARAIISGNIIAVKEYTNKRDERRDPELWRGSFFVTEGAASFGAGILELAVISRSETVLREILEYVKADEQARVELLDVGPNRYCPLNEAIVRAASRNEARLLKMLIEIIPKPEGANLGAAFLGAITAGANEAVQVLADVVYSGDALSKAIELGNAETLKTLVQSKHAHTMLAKLPPLDKVKMPRDVRRHDAVWSTLREAARNSADPALRKKFPPSPPRTVRAQAGGSLDLSALLLNNEIATWQEIRKEASVDMADLMRYGYLFEIQTKEGPKTWKGSLLHVAAAFGKGEHIREIAQELGSSVEPLVQSIEWDGLQATAGVTPSSGAVPTKRGGRNLGWTPLRVAVQAGQLQAAAVLIELEGKHEAWRSTLLPRKAGLLETALRSPFYEAKMIELLVAGAAKYPVLRDRIFGVEVKMSALGWAVVGQHPEAVRTLLAAADADPNMAAIVLRPGNKKESALNIAASRGMSEMVQILLSSESYRHHIEADVRNRAVNVIQEGPDRRYISALFDHYFPTEPREDETSMRLKALGALVLIVLTATTGQSM